MLHRKLAKRSERSGEVSEQRSQPYKAESNQSSRIFAAFEKKLTRVVAHLEKTTVDTRESIYQNVIKFAEIHQRKVRIGLYAPTKGIAGPDGFKATGTEHFKFF